MCNFALFHSNLDNHKNNLGMKKGFTSELIRRYFRRNDVIYQNIFVKNLVFEIMRKIGC